MPGLPANTVEKLMSVREVAEALGVSEDSVLRSAKELFPGLVRNGIPTLLGIFQVTRIKERLATHHNLRSTAEVQGATTALEIHEMTLKVIDFHRAEADRLRYALQAAQPAIESHAALMRSEGTMSITDAAKHFGLHPKAEVFPYLREAGYLTARDIPTQAAIDAGYLALRQTRCPDGEVRGQAVVLTSQLETWRVRVVPQIHRWKAASA